MCYLLVKVSSGSITWKTSGKFVAVHVKESDGTGSNTAELRGRSKASSYHRLLETACIRDHLTSGSLVISFEDSHG